jgi:hypothetical protein
MSNPDMTLGLKGIIVYFLAGDKRCDLLNN